MATYTGIMLSSQTVQSSIRQRPSFTCYTSSSSVNGMRSSISPGMIQYAGEIVTKPTPIRSGYCFYQNNSFGAGVRPTPIRTGCGSFCNLSSSSGARLNPKLQAIIMTSTQNLNGSRKGVRAGGTIGPGIATVSRYSRIMTGAAAIGTDIKVEIQTIPVVASRAKPYDLSWHKNK